MSRTTVVGLIALAVVVGVIAVSLSRNAKRNAGEGEQKGTLLFWRLPRGTPVVPDVKDRGHIYQVAVNTGKNGRRETEMAATDVDTAPKIQMGKGLANTVCVTAGPAGNLSTPPNNKAPAGLTADDTTTDSWIDDGTEMTLDNAGY